jgi:prevent-host-death family protein
MEEGSMTVSLKEARKRLGHLVEAAERGESVVITRRGRVVARIVPPESRPLKGLPDLAAFRASIKIKGRTLTDELLAMRREERY